MHSMVMVVMGYYRYLYELFTVVTFENFGMSSGY